MTLDVCADQNCPHARRVRELESELRALRLGEDQDSKRCTAMPGGERCGLRAGHEGKHVWLRGD